MWCKTRDYEAFRRWLDEQQHDTQVMPYKDWSATRVNMLLSEIKARLNELLKEQPTHRGPVPPPDDDLLDGRGGLK